MLFGSYCYDSSLSWVRSINALCRLGRVYGQGREVTALDMACKRGDELLAMEDLDATRSQAYLDSLAD